MTALGGWYLKRLGGGGGGGGIRVCVVGQHIYGGGLGALLSRLNMERWTGPERLLEGRERAKLWHSTEVIERVDAQTVRTASGATYVLVGAMEERACITTGDIPAELAAAFADTSLQGGFPENWRALLARPWPRRSDTKRTAKVF